MDGKASIAAFAERCRNLRTMGDAVAEEAGPKVHDYVKGTAEGGTTPDGKKWKKIQAKDKHAPLQNAASQVNLTIRKGVITLYITGHHVFHNFGTTRGVPRRQIIPNTEKVTPQKIVDLVDASANEVFARMMGVV